MLLALRALKLGDLLVAVPALRGLRRGFPGHEIVLAAPDWLAPIAALVEGVDALLPTPGLDRRLPLERGSVDIAANLHGNGARSRELIEALDARLRIVHRSEDAPEADPGAPPWIDGVLERERWARLVRAYGAPAEADDVAIRVPTVPAPALGAAVIHVGAAHGSRRWPVDRFAEVAVALAAEGLRPVITGGEADRERALAVAGLAGVAERDVTAGRMGLGEFAALVSGASLVITADTGAGHLASAYRTPSVVIFGPAPPEEWGPPPGPHRALTVSALRRGDVFAEDPDPALLAVRASDVLAAARALLAAPAPGCGR